MRTMPALADMTMPKLLIEALAEPPIPRTAKINPIMKRSKPNIMIYTLKMRFATNQYLNFKEE